MTTRAASALRLTGVAGAVLLAAGCGVLSPVQTDDPYIPADGVPLTIPGLDFRNLLVVADAEGGPGTVVGQAVNEGADAVDVAFGFEGGQPTRVTVQPYSDDALSLDGTAVVVQSVPDPPGALVELVVVTAEAGRNVVQVPVLPSTRYYTGLAPSAIPAAPTPSPSTAPDPGTSPSPGPSTTPSPSPSS